MNKENLLGFDICNTTPQELIINIFSDFNNGINNFIVNVNPEIIINNYKNKSLIKILNKENYQIADGIGIIYASKITHGIIKERICGIDLMNAICKNSVNYDCRIFLYGGKKDVSDLAKKELEKKYSKINIVGTCNGYENEIDVIKKINKSNANILFVGLGNPKQEEFIIANRNKLSNIKLFMPIGGSLDVISKNLRRAPKWIIKLNLEWFYRLLKEPKRFFRDIKLIKFIFLIFINRKRSINFNE